MTELTIEEKYNIHIRMRWDLINALIEVNKYKSYLEIGVHNGNCFERIICEKKVGVDPYEFSKATVFKTSDEFFADNIELLDIIFIDGLHHADQVYKDIVNAVQALKPNGTIIVHDCNPLSKEAQEVPRGQSEWNGDVWKAWVKLRSERPDLEMCVLNMDEGCGIIKLGNQEPLIITEELTWENLVKNRTEWLNLVDTIQLKYAN